MTNRLILSARDEALLRLLDHTPATTTLILKASESLPGDAVDSRAEQSIREKLVRYEAYQDSLVAWHNAQTASASWPYFRVIFLTRSVERANHILWLARECARNADRHLVYAATQNAYLTEPRALQTPLFVDHHGRWQALVNVHPTSNFQRTPVRLTRPVTRLATVR